MTKIYINGQLRDMTSAEETEHQEAHKNLIADKKIRTDALEVKKNNQASGKQKLKDLGLDDDEIQALIGV